VVPRQERDDPVAFLEVGDLEQQGFVVEQPHRHRVGRC
jgi:hypothetical protein